MIGDLPVRFDQPIWLLVILLIIPAFLISRRSIGGQTRTKAYVTLGLRAALLTALAVALAHPSWERRGEGVTVTILFDRSQSVPIPLKQAAKSFLSRAIEYKERSEDRVAVISINRDAYIRAMPDPLSAVPKELDEGDPSGTNLAAGIRLAIAIAPDDTINRFVLASDGNETVDSVMAAAELAVANDIPIDVLVLDYEYENEVIFEQIVAPPRARQGQTARVRLVLRSQGQNAGTIRLLMNGAYMDLNGALEGDGLHVELDPGTTALEQTISLDESGPHQFDAVFIPDDPTMDAIDRNNTAVAVTFVGGQGKVLLVARDPGAAGHLRRALVESGITVEVQEPAGLEGGLVQLSAFDAVVLIDIPRWDFDGVQDRMLHAYVHDLGGGLIMVGGTESFGAGGWIDSELSKALPVKLNPPDTRQMPAGALALVMHSCEMPQGNYWGQKVAQSAIEALSRLDYVGIVEFSWGGAANGIQGCSWVHPMQRVGDKKAALAATKTMQMGDMPAFAPSMQLALNGLLNTNAAQRHSIIISDGDPSPPSKALVQQYINNKVSVSCVMVGGHGGVAADRQKMQAVARATGGQFYEPKNPKALPQIFIKEARIVSRSLIQDGDVYSPQVVSGLPGPTRGFTAVPQIDGYVLTAPREGLAQNTIVIPTTEGKDPLFASWNYGLGRSVAYTSDLSERWGARWASWARFEAFWEQSVRWAMRPSSPANVYVNTRLEGDRAIVEIEALDADASFLNFLQASGVVLRPDAVSEPLPLQQTGPGLYRTEFKVDEAGAYLVNVAYQTSVGDRTEQGNIQAAVSVPYPREFRTVKHNGSLLLDLAERTGGRVLDASTPPEFVDLFDRGSLDMPRTLKRVWDILAILAAALLILDVAARRIAIDPATVARLAGRAVGRRADASTDTVAAWKRTRDKIAHRQSGVKKKAAQVRTARFEAQEGDPEVSVEGSIESPGAKRPTAPKPQAPDVDDEDEGAYTSRLLAAKRRARREAGDAGADDGGDGGRS